MAARRARPLHPLHRQHLHQQGVGRRDRATDELRPAPPRCAELDAHRTRRGFSRRRPHRQAPRRLLPLADRHDDALGGVEPVAGRLGRRGARVHRRLSRRGAVGGALSLAVGPERAELRRLAAVQRLLLCPAHRTPHAVRAAPRSLVRRGGRGGAGWTKAGVRLGADLGAGPQAAAGRGHLFRRGARRPVDRQRARRGGRPELVHRESRHGALPRRRRRRRHRHAPARRPARHGVASRRGRRVDPTRLVLAPGGGRPGALGGRPGGVVFQLGGEELEAPPQRAADPGRPDPPDRRGAAARNARAAGGRLRRRPLLRCGGGAAGDGFDRRLA